MAFTRRPYTNKKPLTGAMSPQQASFIETICNKLGIPNPTLYNTAMTKQEASDFISKFIDTFNIVSYLTSKYANKCKGPNGIERAGYQIYTDIFCPYFIIATNCPVDLADKLFDPDEIGFDFEVMINCIVDAINITLGQNGYEPHLEVDKTNVANNTPPYCRISTIRQTTGYANSIISKVASAKTSAQPVAQAQPVQATPTVSAPPVAQPAVPNQNNSVNIKAIMQNIVAYLITDNNLQYCCDMNGNKQFGADIYSKVFKPYYMSSTSCGIDAANAFFEPLFKSWSFKKMLDKLVTALNNDMRRSGLNKKLQIINIDANSKPYCKLVDVIQTAQPGTVTTSAPPVVQPAVQPAQAQPVQKVSVATDDEWNKLFKVMTTLMGKPANATKDTVLKFINHLCEVLSCGSDNERALAFTRFKRTLQGYVSERCIMDGVVGSTDITYTSKYTWEIFQGRDSKKLDAQSKSTALRLVNKVDVTYFRKDIILKSNYFIHTDARNKFYENDLAHYVMTVMGPIIKSKYNNDIFAFYNDIFSDVKSKAKLWGIPKGILCLIYLYKALNSVKSAPNVTNVAIPKVAQRNRGTVSRDGLRNTFFTY